jgi:formylglycine-generating enzyme required for sulfatase activity
VGHPTPVGLFPKGETSEGLSDILGNVWEWCEDWYGPYSTGDQENPVGPKDGALKVIRGASWHSQPQRLRVSFRAVCEPPSGHERLGFRCARDLPPA